MGPHASGAIHAKAFTAFGIFVGMPEVSAAAAPCFKTTQYDFDRVVLRARQIEPKPSAASRDIRICLLKVGAAVEGLSSIDDERSEQLAASISQIAGSATQRADISDPGIYSRKGRSRPLKAAVQSTVSCWVQRA